MKYLVSTETPFDNINAAINYAKNLEGEEVGIYKLDKIVKKKKVVNIKTICDQKEQITMPKCPYDGNCDVSVIIDDVIYCERLAGICNG